MLKRIFNRNYIQPKFAPARLGDIKCSIASIEKAKNILKYEPKVSLLTGLEEIVDSYKIYEKPLV